MMNSWGMGFRYTELIIWMGELHSTWLLWMVIPDVFGSSLLITFPVCLIFGKCWIHQKMVCQVQSLIIGNFILKSATFTFFFLRFLFFLNMMYWFTFLLCFVWVSALRQVINKPADGGITALHMAALNGHVESVQLLLDLGASVTEVTVEDGTTIDLIGTFACLLYQFSLVP